MPPKKEPKETVVYPASKGKALPFKPQRPSKVPRIPTTDSEGTNHNKTTKPIAPTRQQPADLSDDDNEELENGPRSNTVEADPSDSDVELDDNPLAAKLKTIVSKPTTSAAHKRKPSHQSSPMFISSRQESDESPDRPPAAPDRSHDPSQSEDVTAISQPLLVRLLHEHFTDKKTKIDKHAIQVLQKYFEVFVREAMARAQLRKKEDAEKAGQPSEVDTSWLEFEDLEKVAAGMLLDF